MSLRIRHRQSNLHRQLGAGYLPFPVAVYGVLFIIILGLVELFCRTILLTTFRWEKLSDGVAAFNRLLHLILCQRYCVPLVLLLFFYTLAAAIQYSRTVSSGHKDMNIFS